MKLRLTLFFLLIITHPVNAYDGIFKILDEEAYTGTFNESYQTQTIEKITQTSNHINGWISVDFMNTVTIDNITYCNTTTPRVQYDVWASRMAWDCAVDYIEVTEVNNYSIDNLTYADINVHLRWYHSSLKYRMRCNLIGCRLVPYVVKKYYEEYTTFTDSIETPEMFYQLNSTKIKITIYDNSINPVVKIYSPIQPGEVKTTFQYGNESVERINLMGIVSDDTVDLFEGMYWEDESDIFTPKNDIVFLNINATEFKPAELKITTYSPYDVKENTEFVISINEYESSSLLNYKTMLTTMCTVLFLWGAKKCWNLWSKMI